jgi:two-component system, NarL family, sensor kinase
MRTMLLFAGLGLLLLTLVAVVGIVVLRRVATDQAMADARDLTALSARIVEPRLVEGVVARDPLADARLASVVTDAVLHDPIVSVRLWTIDGEIVYADRTGSALIGKTFPNALEGLDALVDGVDVRSADVSAPQNVYLRHEAALLDAYTLVHTPAGTPLIFETLQRSSSVTQGAKDLLTSFAPVLLVTLVVLALLLVPLSWALATRLQRAARDRARLLQETIEVSERERRRIAADLHDGPVQQLAGLAMRLSAQSMAGGDDEAASTLGDAAEGVRSSVRTLRSAIVGIYPPNLDAEGLGQALSDLTARLPAQGLEVSLRMDDPLGYGPAVDRLLFRACQEGLRNIESHASAEKVDVVVRRQDGCAVLVVSDDGRGIDGSDAARARRDGHLGLELLRDLVQDAGGTMTISAADGGGTSLRVEVPA